jgi:hypothetical protein
LHRREWVIPAQFHLFQFTVAKRQALQSKNRNERNAAAVYGGYGEKSGVGVSFTTERNSNTSFTRDLAGVVTGVSVEINSNAIAGANDKKGTVGNVFAEATVAHEGSHVEDRMNLIHHDFNPMFNMTNRESELRAYRLTNSIAQRHNIFFPDAQGNPIDLDSDRAINRFLDSTPHEEEPLDELICKYGQ